MFSSVKEQGKKGCLKHECVSYFTVAIANIELLLLTAFSFL